jgi:hypothetical protein
MLFERRSFAGASTRGIRRRWRVTHLLCITTTSTSTTSSTTTTTTTATAAAHTLCPRPCLQTASQPRLRCTASFPPNFKTERRFRTGRLALHHGAVRRSLHQDARFSRQLCARQLPGASRSVRPRYYCNTLRRPTAASSAWMSPRSPPSPTPLMLRRGSVEERKSGDTLQGWHGLSAEDQGILVKCARCPSHSSIM